MQKLRSVITLCGFGFGMLGTGIHVAHALDVLCPEDMTATWVGAASGQTTKFNRNMIRFRVLDQPTKNLACAPSPSTPGDKLTVVVQLGAGAIPALCGGKASISGLAPTAGGVPPFGGFPFVSGKITAVPTYDQTTGRCQLDLPIRSFVTGVTVTQACTPIFENVWSCPSNSHPVSALFEPRAERFASLALTNSPEIFRVLSAYDAFARTPFGIRSEPSLQTRSSAAFWAEL